MERSCQKCSSANLNKKLSKVIGHNSMLKELKVIHKTVGDVCAFSMNSLALIDYLVVLDSLGNRTYPNAQLKFTECNVNISGACGVGVKKRLSVYFQKLIGDSLLDSGDG